jgi:hypothetical protein
MIVSCFSAGVSSFVATYLVRDKVDKIVYMDVENQHEDSMRFVRDCEKVLGKEIEILQSRYKNVENVIRQFQMIRRIKYAICTDVLKKRVRKEWEQKQTEPIEYIWGFDLSETDRAERILESMPEFTHHFPLIDKKINKDDAHGMCWRLGIKRPIMYDLGYNNNNCIGCVKGGMGYWNKIRIDFPEVFESMAKLEREIGHSCINGVFLDELEPNRGNMSEEIMGECSIFCHLAL